MVENTSKSCRSSDEEWRSVVLGKRPVLLILFHEICNGFLHLIFSKLVHVFSRLLRLHLVA